MFHIFVRGINGVLIEKSTLVVGSRAEGGVASKLRDETRLMTMKVEMCWIL